MIRSLIDPQGTRMDSGIKEWRRGVLCALLLVGSVAAAQEAGTGVSGAWAPGVETRDDPAHFRVGINVGLIGLPRPLTIEGYARVHPYLGLSGGWSYFPKFLSDRLLSAVGAQSETTNASLNDFSAWEIALRVYPLRGTFFVGLGAGQQNVEGTVTEKLGGFAGAASVSAQSWTLTPRIGWQWIWASGLAMGVDLGVQFTISHQETLILPPGTPPNVAHDARKYLEFGATLPLPSLNFRIGYHLG